MQIVEQQRSINPSGENVAVFDTGKLLIRLIGTFGEQAKLNDLLYTVMCQRIEDKMGNTATSLFENAAMV